MAIKESMMVRHMEDDKHLKHIINPEPSLSNNYKNKQNINMYNYLYIVFLQEVPIPLFTRWWNNKANPMPQSSKWFVSCGPIWQHCHDATTMTPIHFILAPRGHVSLPWHHQRVSHHSHNLSHLPIFIHNDFSIGCYKRV